MVKEASVPADTPVKGTQRVTITFAASEAELLAQAESAKMAELESESTQKGVPEGQTLFVNSISESRELLGSAGVACDYGLPASEAKAPDEAANCTTEIVISRWDLDTDWSKLRFETQKEHYSEEGSAPSLFGQN